MRGVVNRVVGEPQAETALNHGERVVRPHAHEEPVGEVPCGALEPRCWPDGRRHRQQDPLGRDDGGDAHGGNVRHKRHRGDPAPAQSANQPTATATAVKGPGARTPSQDEGGQST